MIFLRSITSFSQSSDGETTIGVTVNYAILPDKGYTFERIQTDTSLHFIREALHPEVFDTYWMKIVADNHNEIAQPYLITIFPNLNNTLYCYSENAKKWTNQRSGLNVLTNRDRSLGRMQFFIASGKPTIFYVKISLEGKHADMPFVKPQILLEKEGPTVEKDRFFTTAWLISMAVLLILFLNSFHLYYRFRDRSLLYFLVVQVGGMLYLTAYRGIFKVLFVGRPFTYQILPNGMCYAYSMNQIFMHLSVAIILYGLVQMTRNYLQTNFTLPKWDLLLKYSLGGYLIFTAVIGFINVCIFYIDGFTLLLDNIIVFLLMSMLIAACIAGYRRKIAAARVYLLAHAVPLLFLIGIAVYHVFVSFNYSGQLLLPDFGVVSQALCFSIAIVSRIKILQEKLVLKEEERNRLAVDIKQIDFRQWKLSMENEQIQKALNEAEAEHSKKQLESEKLHLQVVQQQAANKELNEKLDLNRRELASSTLYVVQKNAMLAELKSQIEELNRKSPGSKSQQLSSIKSLLQSNIHLDDDWNRFKQHFEQVHPSFFENVQQKYPALTKNELRLYSYFHINLSTKEIASLLNIDPASVRRAKTRLYKKIAFADKGLLPPKEVKIPDEL